MLHILYNPIAGHGRAARFRSEVEVILTRAGLPHRFHETHGAGSARELTRVLTETAAGTVDIVAMGGDGTLHEVLNGLADPSKVRLGLIPCGGGNDFAAAARIPTTAQGAASLLIQGRTRPTDYMVCGGIRGMNLIGAGLDVDILRLYNRQRLKGSAGYALALLRSLASFRFRNLVERTHGRSAPHSALIACVGNGQRCGGGITLCPEAVIDDGLLDIFIVGGVKKRQIPSALIKLVQKRLTELPFTIARRDTAVAFDSDRPLAIQIDGEIYDNIPFDVRIVHDGLVMFRP